MSDSFLGLWPGIQKVFLHVHGRRRDTGKGALSLKDHSSQEVQGAFQMGCPSGQALTREGNTAWEGAAWWSRGQKWDRAEGK